MLIDLQIVTIVLLVVVFCVKVVIVASSLDVKKVKTEDQQFYGCCLHGVKTKGIPVGQDWDNKDSEKQQVHQTSSKTLNMLKCAHDQDRDCT